MSETKGEHTMKKRWTAALLALFLAAALLPDTAWAAQTDRSAGSRLTGVERAVYDVLKAEVIKIANGSRTSTAIEIPDQAALSWTLEELGVTGSSRQNILDRMEEAFAQSLHMDMIYDCLSMDLPFEMYWKSNQFACGYSLFRVGNRTYIRDLTIQLQAAQAYQAESNITVSPAKVAAAKNAAENAKYIVDKHKDESDYEKLISYRDEICQLVSYDLQAAGNDNMPYGDPWQLVSVFDGVSSTNVVCEGYAKAFKYLCDLSDFDGDITCYIVNGLMDGSRHMWNVVRMEDGTNYLADVTNSDSGMMGDGGELFLSGAAGSDGGRTWAISKGYCQAVYTYDEDLEGRYADGYLALSSHDYTYDPAAAETDSAQSGGFFVDVPSWQYYAQPVAWALEQKITGGTSPNTFSPDQPCTHAEILTFLWRAAGRPKSEHEAPDGIQEDGFFYDAAKWAAETGMIDGSSNLSAPCTRGDAVQYIWQAFGRPEAPGSPFDDVPDGSFYADAAAWAAQQRVAAGTSLTTFQPDLVCSRGQIVTFLYRAYQ